MRSSTWETPAFRIKEKFVFPKSFHLQNLTINYEHITQVSATISKKISERNGIFVIVVIKVDWIGVLWHSLETRVEENTICEHLEQRKYPIYQQEQRKYPIYQQTEYHSKCGGIIVLYLSAVYLTDKLYSSSLKNCIIIL